MKKIEDFMIIIIIIIIIKVIIIEMKTITFILINLMIQITNTIKKNILIIIKRKKMNLT